MPRLDGQVPRKPSLSEYLLGVGRGNEYKKALEGEGRGRGACVHLSLPEKATFEILLKFESVAVVQLRQDRIVSYRMHFNNIDN